MRHILIGGNGFLGQELTRQVVASGAEALVVDLASSLAGDLGSLSPTVHYVQADIERRSELEAIPLRPGDAVHHLASRLITPNKPRWGRDRFFWTCIVDGTRNVLDWLESREHRTLVYWSTDMVYGPALSSPRDESHPRKPFGPYGRAKVAAEDLIFATRKRGVAATVLRPRLIIGPGRLGIMTTLFALVQRGLPIPLIGDGSNRFQFVSVADCARASLLAVSSGYPDMEINLGSSEPPTTYELLSELLARSGSRSPLLRTPAGLIKAILRALSLLKMSPMDQEQFEIADQDVTLDIRRAHEVLGWSPSDSDQDMLFQAWQTFTEDRTDVARRSPT